MVELPMGAEATILLKKCNCSDYRPQRSPKTRHGSGCLATRPANPPPRPREAPRRRKGAGISLEIETQHLGGMRRPALHVARARGSRLRLKRIFQQAIMPGTKRRQEVGISLEIEMLELFPGKIAANKSQGCGDLA